MSPLRLSRSEVAFVVGVPIAWAILLLFHPGGDATQVYAVLGRRRDSNDHRPCRDDGLHSVAGPRYLAAIARNRDSCGSHRPCALCRSSSFSTWRGRPCKGSRTGSSPNQVAAMPDGDQDLGASLIQDFAETPLVRDLGILGLIGTAALLVAMIATGVALREAGAPRWTPWALGLAGVPDQRPSASAGTDWDSRCSRPR